eukprot:366510-Chlamydomonas_euryale.AAC.32
MQRYVWPQLRWADRAKPPSVSMRHVRLSRATLWHPDTDHFLRSGRQAFRTRARACQIRLALVRVEGSSLVDPTYGWLTARPLSTDSGSDTTCAVCR